VLCWIVTNFFFTFFELECRLTAWLKVLHELLSGLNSPIVIFHKTWCLNPFSMVWSFGESLLNGWGFWSLVCEPFLNCYDFWWIITQQLISCFLIIVELYELFLNNCRTWKTISQWLLFFMNHRFWRFIISFQR